MGKERDKLIRSLGGVSLSDQNPSDEEIVRLRMERYAREGRLPPEMEALRAREREGEAGPGPGAVVSDAHPRVVGYGTLLRRPVPGPEW